MINNISGVGKVEVRPDDDEKVSKKERRLFGLQEAPTLEPSEEEFKDPQEYIKSLGPLGEKYGILKIIPPDNWRPKFSLDTSTFKFITRTQKINRMGAVARSILDYAERIEKFHYLQHHLVNGFPRLKTGTQKTIKLYEFKCSVENSGGIEIVSSQDLWNQLVAKLGLSTINDDEAAEQLKDIYMNVIQPYEDYVEFASKQKPFSDDFAKNSPPSTTKDVKDEEEEEEDEQDQEENDVKPMKIRLRLRNPRNAKCENTDESESETHPGKRRKVHDDTIRRSSRRLNNNRQEEEEEEEDDDEKEVEGEEEEDTDGNIACEVCEEALDITSDTYFSCKSCPRYYHSDCLSVKISIVPYTEITRFENWYCPYCLIGTCEFYFQEGEHQYSLREFKERAEDFKETYMEDYHIPIDLENTPRDIIESQVEREFWSHIECLNNCDLSVEYGADIHCDTKGSGFPTLTNQPFSKYSRHGWNLNNFPQLRTSLFHNMKEDISGVTVPWAYVGMTFSAFCWHSEDHYTYSVNYQHLGDTKTWYGIPGSQAEKFEEIARSTAPEIFEKQPNILFQRGTILSPEIVKANGVDCYVIDQRAGQFVITFPKAYHAGFNHGFNFNEAVNYAPPDWVPFGLESVKNYQSRAKEPIFSHDSLFILTAEKDEHADTAKWLSQYIKEMVTRDRYDQETILQYYHGRIPKVYDRNDVSEEDYYQCNKCKYMAYLSRVIGKDPDTEEEKRYCVKHLPKDALRLEVRFKDDYLPSLYERLLRRIPESITLTDVTKPEDDEKKFPENFFHQQKIIQNTS